MNQSRPAEPVQFLRRKTRVFTEGGACEFHLTLGITLPDNLRQAIENGQELSLNPFRLLGFHIVQLISPHSTFTIEWRRKDMEDFSDLAEWMYMDCGNFMKEERSHCRRCGLSRF
jgi:hypothetical protein